MAKTAAVDSLFLANAATVNAMENSKRVQAEGASFSQAMTDASKDAPLGMTKSDDLISSRGVSVESRRKPQMNADNAKASDDTSKVKAADETQAKGEDTEIAKEVINKADNIKEEIKDKLGVTDEDIENAMTALGLLPQDLLNADSLKDLVMEISECEDSFDFLTNADLYKGMQDILNTAGDIVKEIAQSFGISEIEVNALLDDSNLFEKVLEENNNDLGNVAFGPNMENEAFQAEVPEIAPESNRFVPKEERLLQDDFHRVNVTLVKEDEGAGISSQSRTETFRNISLTEKSQFNNEQGMQDMPMSTTSVSVNELGEVVKTVESFSSSFSDGNSIMSQVTETIKLNVGSDTTSMEMLLHPASLGTVNMQISSQNGVITAHILVQNEAVRAALESQLSVLLDTFEEQGRSVEAVEVSVANYDLDRGMNQQQDERERENAFRMGKSARRRLRLDDISDEDITELEEGEQIAADMMRRQGNTLDYMA